MSFNFQYYAPIDDDWCLSGLKTEQDIKNAMYSFRDISAKSLKEISANSKFWNFHPIDWSRSTQKQGFEVAALEELEAFQFALKHVGPKCRVHGALSKDIFYVVWIDIKHQLLPSEKKHT